MALPVADTIRAPVAATRGRFGRGAPANAPVAALSFYRATPEQITLSCKLSRQVAEGSLARLYYKLPSSTAWTEAHPLLQVRPAEVTSGSPTVPESAFKGAIFDLAPGTTYDVRVVVTEPGMPALEVWGQRATRALPATAGAATKTATPASNLQALVSALVPGDVLQLADGTYTLSAALMLAAVGTAIQPITIRGATRSGVVIQRASNAVLEVTTGRHTVIENLTIQGSGVDSGTQSSSVGLLFWAGAVAEGITIRHVNFVGVDKGVSTINANQVLVYECDLQGNNTWDKAYTINPASGEPNFSWNDDGLLLAGEGNCAWNCSLTGFGDATSSGHSATGGRANYFYRLDIAMTCDDAHEGDYTDGPCGFYDNRIGNSGTLFSADPVWGGPFFVFRNASANTIRGPWKLNDANSGVLIYNNTVVRNADASGFGNYQSGAGGSFSQRSLSMRNNLEVVRGAVTGRLRWDCFVDRLDWTNNAYYPDGPFIWSVAPDAGGASLNAARTQLPAKTLLFGAAQRHANDIITSSNPWAETIALGPTFTTQFTATPNWALAGGSNARTAGVAIPGVTDGFSGIAPDIGGVITGRAVVAYGRTDTSVPAWLAAIPVGSVAQAPGPLLRSFDPEDDPVANPGLGVPSWRGTGGQPAIMTAWGTATFDPVTGRMRITRQGGHGDYGGNEDYALDYAAATPTITRLTNPSAATGGSVASGVYGDGKHRPVHGYNAWVRIPGYGVYSFGSFAIFPTGAETAPNYFVRHDEAGAQTVLNATCRYTSPSGSCAAWDPWRLRAYVRGNGTTSVEEFDPATDTVTNLHDTFPLSRLALNGACSMTVVASGIVLFGNGSRDEVEGVSAQTYTGHFAIYNVLTRTMHTPVFSGAPTVLAQAFPNGLWGGECQPVWDEEAKCAYAWDNLTGTNQVMRLTPSDPTFANLNAPWAIDYITFSGTVSAAAVNGTCGRAAWWPQHRTLLVHNRVTERAHAFRFPAA